LPAVATQRNIEALYQAADPWYWAYSNNIQLVGGPFTLDGHEFQVRPMSVQPRIKVVRKATQTYFTESEVLSCLGRLIHGVYPRGVLYLFPSKEEVTDFSSSRFNPLINDNPATIGCHVRETNRANLRRIGSGFLYFRSGRLSSEIQGQAKSSSHLKSIPVDHATHDEYDEMHARIDEFVDGRLADSSIGTKSYLANPTLPDYGISAKFDQSSQEYWFIKCQACGKSTCMDDADDSDPLVHLHEFQDGRVIRACSHCDRSLDPRFGEWVAKRQTIMDILGFTIGHPSIYRTDPAALLRDWRATRDRANFIRLKLGRPFIEAENRLSVTQVLALCGDHGIAQEDEGPCSMGVDQGLGLHVVIGNPDGAILHINEYRDWEELDGLMLRFHVQKCVVDGLPETRNARAFSQRHPGKVYLNYYNEHQKGSYSWNDRDMIVSCNRTESLDSSHRQVMDQAIMLPRESDIVQTFAQQLHNVAKKLEEDEETGSRRYVYVKLGADHYRHAFNYECMARQNMPDLLFPEYAN
jgi:hypothetical protein